jgi:PAS domain S-box-containing protein
VEHFADHLVAGMSDAIVYADSEGAIRLWNNGATRIIGFTEAEAWGRPLDLILPENPSQRHLDGYRSKRLSRAMAKVKPSRFPPCARMASEIQPRPLFASF